MKYKPAIDKYFWIIWISTMILLLLATLFSLIEPLGFIILLLVDVFCIYFMVSSLVGYVEVKENSLFIKFGFILKKDIPYNTIREVVKERKFFTYSALSMKNAMEHINIKYNKYDVVTVSVIDNDRLLYELKKRISNDEN